MSTLEVTTAVPCPNGCCVCPQATLLGAYGGGGIMTLDDWRTILAKVPSFVRIDFSAFCEPWVNPHCTEMILMAAERHPVSVYTTLSHTTSDDIAAILAVPFVAFCVHLPDALGMFEVPSREDDWDVVAEVVDSAITNLRFNTLSPDRELAAGAPSVKLSILVINSRAGSLWERKRIRGPIRCRSAGLAFDRNVVLPNGDVVLCCMDFGLRHTIGNLLSEEYAAILNGSRHRAIRAAAQGDGDLLCRRCEYAKVV